MLTDLLQQKVSARGTVRMTLLRRPRFPTTSTDDFEFTIDSVGWHKVNHSTKIGTMFGCVQEHERQKAGRESK